MERTFLSAHVHETETSESCVGVEMMVDALERCIKKRHGRVERTFLSAHVHETETSESRVGVEMIDSRYL